VNPDDLQQCLECGNPIPRLAEVPWNPIAPPVNPASPISDLELQATSFDFVENQPELQSPKKGLFSTLRERLRRGKKAID
jgi:hypothetical protein